MLNKLGDVIYKKKNFYYDDILEKRAKILKRIHLAASREKAREKVKKKKQPNKEYPPLIIISFIIIYCYSCLLPIIIQIQTHNNLRF